VFIPENGKNGRKVLSYLKTVKRHLTVKTVKRQKDLPLGCFIVMNILGHFTFLTVMPHLTVKINKQQ